MKKTKYNLKELMADAARDAEAAKPVHKIISQENIAELIKKASTPAKTLAENEK